MQILFENKSLIILVIFFELINAKYTLHTSSGCFSKHFRAFNFTTSENDDVPIRENGEACGEDDFLITELRHLKLLAVADGVGSWNNYGINPKYFVSEFMSAFGEMYRSRDHQTIRDHDLESTSFIYQSVFYSMNALIGKAIRTGNAHYGSCTLAALSLNMKNLYVNTYLMGDAGFMIIRNGMIFERSIDQVRGFNFPFQLGILRESDHPVDAITNSFQLKPEDVIIVGSDGLFDNLFDSRILEVVNREMLNVDRKNKIGYTQAARNIVKSLTVEAKKLGEAIQNVWTPFGFSVALNFGVPFYGGKNDDTTLIIGIVTDE